MNTEYTFISKEEYIAWLQAIAIVHKVIVLYDEPGEEISLRIEYLENMARLDSDILEQSNRDLTKITAYIRITGYRKMILSYLQKEVLEYESPSI